MDVNLNTEVKAYGIPTVPVVERDDATKPQIAPVQADAAPTNAKLDDKALHDKQKKGSVDGIKMTKADAEKLIAQVQSRLDAIGGNLSLGLTEYQPTKDIVVQVKDNTTNKLIRQFPSEELLKLKARLEDLVGILFNEKA